MTALSTRDLFELDDADVHSIVTTTFVQQLKNSPSTKNTFFASEPGTVSPANVGFTDSIAASLVCSSIGLSSLYGFHKSVNVASAHNYWQSNLTDGNANAVTTGQALYEWAFPDHCRSANATFRDYMNDRSTNWGQALAATVTTTPFINDEILKIFAQANWLARLNLIFYKINRLDATQLTPVLNIWTQRYPDQGIVNTWNHKTFVPAPNFTQVPDQFIGQVNTAISVKTQTGKTSIPGDPNTETPGYWIYDYTYGLAVQKFLGGLPAHLGLTTRISPDNTQSVNDDQSGGSSSGCFVAGTRVQLAEGTETPIEQVQEGHAVLGKDGGISRHSDERVVLTLERGEFIYGIDDGQQPDVPFFSGGHLFWTAEGWKALDPETALMENPQRTIGKLGPGDVVYRLQSVHPLSYAEVRIQGFSRAFLDEGEKLYGLHLIDGPHSYHANGYLVGMNYPQLTIRRFANGVSRLSEAERKHLAKCLDDAMPLLAHAIGPFIGPALRQAIDQAQVTATATAPHANPGP